MATHLQGVKTRFLPFNQGQYGGAGNPPAVNGSATSYLWERIWARDSVLNLIQQFVHVVEEEDANARKTGKRSLIFPRYHRLEAVNNLVQEVNTSGPAHRYLIQHSTGSGKSNSIAWLAHQLTFFMTHWIVGSSTPLSSRTDACSIASFGGPSANLSRRPAWWKTLTQRRGNVNRPSGRRQDPLRHGASGVSGHRQSNGRTSWQALRGDHRQAHSPRREKAPKASRWFSPRGASNSPRGKSQSRR